MAGVEALVGAGVPVVVRWGRQHPTRPCPLAAPAARVGAQGLMVHPEGSVPGR